jgi:hypothetical protein
VISSQIRRVVRDDERSEEMHDTMACRRGHHGEELRAKGVIDSGPIEGHEQPLDFGHPDDLAVGQVPVPVRPALRPRLTVKHQ